MPDDLHIQRYTEADRSGVFAVLREAFSEQYANHLMRIWDWKYDSHPLNREAEQVRRADRNRMWAWIKEDYPEAVRAGFTIPDLNPVPEDAPYFLVLKHGERVVATQGSLPRVFLINGERCVTSIGCDFAVHPEYRGQFLSMRLAHRAGTEHPISVGWSNPSSWTSGKKWQKKIEPDMRQFTPANPPISGEMRAIALVKPIDWNYVVQRATGIKLPARITALAGANRGARAKSAAMPGVDVFNLESFDQRVDDLWQRCSRQHQVIGVRDRDYLNWRFSSRPDTSYVCLAAARRSQIIGYLIYRIVEREGGRIGYIVDFLSEGGRDSAFAALVATAEQRMVRDGAQAIVCPLAQTDFRKVLHRAGFYSALGGARSYLSAGVSMPNDRTKVFVDLPKWFITIADGDAEMSF